MNEKEVVRALMAECGWSQATLAEKAGFASQSNVTGLLNQNRKGMRFDNLLRLVNAMGYEIVVRDTRKNGKEFIVDSSTSEGEKT